MTRNATTAAPAMPITAATQRGRSHRRRPAPHRRKPCRTLMLRTRRDANRSGDSPPNSPRFLVYMRCTVLVVWAGSCSPDKGTAIAMNRAGRRFSRTAGKRTGRLAGVGLSGLLLIGSATGPMVGAAGASAADGTLTVEVLRDFFGTGVINTTMDVPQQGMKVDVTDPAGHHVTGITDATGKFVVSSRYFVPIQNGASGTDTRALVAFGVNTRGSCPSDVACPTTLATQSQVGTTFGPSSPGGTPCTGRMAVTPSTPCRPRAEARRTCSRRCRAPR